MRLSEAEQAKCHEVIKKLNGSASKVRRTYMLLQADGNGPGWTDEHIAPAYLRVSGQ